MKLHIFSDLHQEIWASQRRDQHGRLMKKDRSLYEGIEDYLAENGNDGVCILAGDICPVDRRFVDEAEAIHRSFASWFKNVVFVPGNHEFYGTSIREGMGILRSWEGPKWHMLEPGDHVTIEGQRFMGGTLWFDGNHQKWQQRCFNDFYQIQGIHDAYLHNQQFVQHVCEKMTSDDIIVSHHLPSPISTPARFADSDVNCFFVSNQERYILERKPKLWVHGHTHDPMDNMLGSTRIYANPRGYPGEFTNPNFWSRVRIDI